MARASRVAVLRLGESGLAGLATRLPSPHNRSCRPRCWGKYVPVGNSYSSRTMPVNQSKRVETNKQKRKKERRTHKKPNTHTHSHLYTNTHASTHTHAHAHTQKHACAPSHTHTHTHTHTALATSNGLMLFLETIHF